MMLYTGYVSCYRLTILLKSNDSIPFQLTANFEEQSLCYNYLMAQSWGQPQKIQTPFFLFYPEKFFEIIVLSEAGQFRLAFNGTPLGDFCPPVFDPKSINELQIRGSAELFHVLC
uniref:Galectin n=1 Tax=Pyxicephalus adspersus TaxID=30357 RepID=A0AAV3A0M3_PYXAD|nr:TPA: hypothetical protein GDO54_002686 [Pyxicephalus adspersus]